MITMPIFMYMRIIAYCQKLHKQWESLHSTQTAISRRAKKEQ
jgi:hypothetical protein